MSRLAKLFERMRRNPQDDWTIDDIRRVCKWAEIDCVPPARGSHWKVSDPSQAEILTVPAHIPILDVYIVKLVKFIEAVREARNQTHAP